MWRSGCHCGQVVGSTHHFAAAHDVDAAAGRKGLEAATVERVDRGSLRVIHCGAQARHGPVAEAYLHCHRHARHLEVEGEIEAVGRDITLGFHIDGFRKTGHPKRNTRQGTRGEGGFARTFERLFLAFVREGQVAEFDVADAERIAAAGFENEVAQFEIHLTVVLGEVDRRGEGFGGARFSAELHRELVGECTCLCAGAQAQQGSENEK